MLAFLAIFLTALGLLSLPLVIGMSVTRGHWGTVEYSTDYTGDASSATWTDIPTLKIQSEGFQNPAEEAQLVQSLNSHDLSAGKKLVGIIPVAYDDDADTFLSALETAEQDLSAVWFRVTPTGENARIIGGDNGCSVYVNRNPTPAWGSLVSALVGFSVTGPNPGDTYRISVTGS